MSPTTVIAAKLDQKKSYIDSLFKKGYMTLEQFSELIGVTSEKVDDYALMNHLTLYFPYKSINSNGPKFVTVDQKMLDMLNKVFKTSMKLKDKEVGKSTKAYEDEFLRRFNKARIHFGENIGKKWHNKKFLDTKSKTQLSKLKKNGVSVDDAIKVVINAFQDSYHKETEFSYITTEYITRDKTYNKYSNG